MQISRKCNETSAHRAARWFVSVLVLVVLASMAVYFFSAPVVYADDLPTSIYISICGDGIVQPNETCDDGAGFNVGTYGSSTGERVCALGCGAFGPYCGDGILQVRFTEECDDGNSTAGDLCTGLCRTETPAVSIPAQPSLGGTPYIPGGSQGAIPSINVTQVVLRGKAFPGGEISILKDGKLLNKVKADFNADFFLNTTEVTAGTATFSFLAKDAGGVESLITSVVFEVVQSAITTVTNIFIPPTVSTRNKQVAPGDFLLLFGQSVPAAKVHTQIDADQVGILPADVDKNGAWALQIDTASLKTGFHSVKSFMSLPGNSKSSFGKSVSFFIGTGSPSGEANTDINNDKKVNLVDFSIFLTHWNTADPRSDFNRDGKVNLADFSIMLFNWTG